MTGDKRIWALWLASLAVCVGLWFAIAATFGIGNHSNHRRQQSRNRSRAPHQLQSGPANYEPGPTAASVSTTSAARQQRNGAPSHRPERNGGLR